MSGTTKNFGWVHPVSGDQVAMEGIVLGNLFPQIDRDVAPIVPAAHYQPANDGVTDDTAVLNTALADTASKGQRLYAKGQFKISGTVTITGNADLQDATFLYSGTGTAVKIGTDATYLFRQTITAPRVTNTLKAATGWAEVAGSIGIQVVNAFSFDIYIPYVQSFETGLSFVGRNYGCGYNRTRIGQLDNNKVNMQLSAEGANGFTNQNTFLSGRYSHNSNEGTTIPGTRHIQIVSNATHPVNQNVWLNASLETPGPVEYNIECGGVWNYWYSCRFETWGKTPKVWWRTGASLNEIVGGYDTNNLVEVYEATSDTNNVSSPYQMRRISKALVPIWLQTQTGANNPALIVTAPGGVQAGAVGTTDYTVSMTSQHFYGKRNTDANPRVDLDYVNGRLYLGNGTVAQQNGILGSGAGLSFTGPGVGFNGTTAIAKPTVTGSRGGNAALASLLTALANMGLVTDNSTA